MAIFPIKYFTTYLFIFVFIFVFIFFTAGTCAKREAPINGALAYKGDAGTLSIYIASCSAGWVPNGPMAFTYLCHHSNRQWTAVPATLPNKWPDCTRMFFIFSFFSFITYDLQCKPSAHQRILKDFLIFRPMWIRILIWHEKLQEFLEYSSVPHIRNDAFNLRSDLFLMI